jgi:hypothetical protein
MGLHLPLKMVDEVAQKILLRSLPTGTDTIQLGPHWTERFMKRHNLKKVKQKPIELARKEAHTPSAIREWFEVLEKEMKKKVIKPYNLWNFDETGFRIGVGGNEWVITMDPKRRAWAPSHTSTKHVSVVEAVNAAGEVIEPMLVVTGVVLQERWFEGLSDETLVGTSLSGYVNDELALEWIQHFERLTRPSNPNEWRLLLCDNYGSHTFFEFLEYAKQHRIVVIGLPPHSSHLLQPLDVVLFQPYKHYHRQAVSEATRTGCTDFNVMEFLCALQGIRNNTFKMGSVKSSFRETGIWPFNPEKVITKLQVEYASIDLEEHFKMLEEQANELLSLTADIVNRVEAMRRLETPPLPSKVPATPLTVRTLQQASHYLEYRLQNELSSPSQAVFERFVKGSHIQAAQGAQAIVDLHQTEAAVKSRKRRSTSKKQLAKGGVLYAKDARKMVKEHNEQEAKKQERKQARLLKKQLKEKELKEKELKKQLKQLQDNIAASTSNQPVFKQVVIDPRLLK